MSGKVKLSITALCLSALALYHASSSGDTSLIRLVYTAIGMGFLVVSFVTAAFKKKLWIVAAAIALAALYGRFIFLNFHRIDMSEVIPEDAAVDDVMISAKVGDEPVLCWWRPGEGIPHITELHDYYINISGGSMDIGGLKGAVFYSHWIHGPTEHIEPWVEDVRIYLKQPEEPDIDIYLRDNFKYDGSWDLTVNDHKGKESYNPDNYKDFYVLTAADLSGLIPDSVAELILSEEKNVAIPTEVGTNKAETTAWTEDYSGNATLDTRLERADEGALLLNCAAHSRWTGDDIPDRMSVTAEAYALFEGATEPVLLDSVTKEGEGVKTRFFSVPQQSLLEASHDGGEPIWVEVRQKTVFTFGDKEKTVNNSVRYER